MILETRRYLIAIAASLPAAAGIFLLEQAAIFPPGAFVGAVELLFELLALGFLALHPDFRRPYPQAPRAALLVFFGFLFMADGFYLIQNFLQTGFESPNAIALTSKAPYAVAFLGAIVAIVLCTGARDLIHDRVFLMCTALAVPLAMQFIILPYLRDPAKSFAPVVMISEATQIVFLVPLLILGLTTFLCARTIGWSLFGAALATMVVGDWAIQVEEFLTGTSAFATYEYLWAYGVFLCAVPVIFGPRLSPMIESFNRHSLLNGFKITALGLSLIPLFFLCIVQHDDVTTVKTVSIGVPFILVFATLWSHQYLSCLTRFSWGLGKLFSGQIPSSRIAAAPVELRSILTQVDAQVAEAKRVQRELQLAVARSDIAARLAHDIRSPLSALRCAIDPSEAIPADVREVVTHAIDRLQAIAFDTLGRERGASSEVAISDEPVISLADRIAGEKRVAWSDSNINLTTQYPPDFQTLFSRVNPHAFERALSNLLDNAKDAVGTGGRIMLAAYANATRLVIEVRDNGIGIPASVLARIGDKGFSWGKASGTGIGFHSSKNSIESWNGSLTIDSKESQGTTVRISLPLVQAQATA